MEQWDENDFVVLQFHNGRIGWAERLKPFSGSIFITHEDFLCDGVEHVTRGTIIRCGSVSEPDVGYDCPRGREIQIYYPGHAFEQTESYKRRFAVFSKFNGRTTCPKQN